MGEDAMKHLKMRAKLRHDHRYVDVTIVEQTHRWKNFGKDDYHYFRASNGIQLGSVTNPAWDYRDDELFLCGDCGEDDNKILMMSIEDWERVKVAVSEYNEWGRTQ
jgi:hypothetical protein